MGRPECKNTISKEFDKYYKRWIANEITGVEFAKLLGISRTSMPDIFFLVGLYHANSRFQCWESALHHD